MTKPAFDYLVAIDFEATCDENYAEPGNVQVPRGEGEIIEVPFVVVSTKELLLQDSPGNPENANASSPAAESLPRHGIVHQQQIYVRPQNTPVTPYCTQLTGITAEMLAEAVSLPEALATVDAWIQEHIVDRGHTFAFVTHGMYDLRNMLWCEAKTKGFLDALKSHWFRFFDVTAETLKWNERRQQSNATMVSVKAVVEATEVVAEQLDSTPTTNTPKFHSQHGRSVLRIDLDASNPRRYRKRLALHKMCMELGIQPRGRLHSGLDDAILIARLIGLAVDPDMEDLYVEPIDIQKELEEFRRNQSPIVHVEGFPFKVTRSEISSWCEQHGFQPTQVHAIRTLDGALTGCAYFVFATHEEANKFFEELHGKTILERCIIVSPSDEQELLMVGDHLDVFPEESVAPTEDALKEGTAAVEETWLCTICKFSNRNNRPTCYKCNARHPHRNLGHTRSGNPHPQSKNNWNCSVCNGFNYAFRFCCVKCKRPSPHPPQPMKPVNKKLLKEGDWVCANAICRAVNHNHRPACYRCDSESTLGRWQRGSQQQQQQPIATRSAEVSADGFSFPAMGGRRKGAAQGGMARGSADGKKQQAKKDEFSVNIGGGFSALSLDDGDDGSDSE